MGIRNGRQIEDTYRRSFRTPQNVGAEAFGGRESSESLGRQAGRISNCSQGLLGIY